MANPIKAEELDHLSTKLEAFAATLTENEKVVFKHMIENGGDKAKRLVASKSLLNAKFFRLSCW